MTTGDQQAFKLAARLMEAGATPSSPLPEASNDHVWRGLFLASRLADTLDEDEAAVAAERLREAAA